MTLHSLNANSFSFAPTPEELDRQAVEVTERMVRKLKPGESLTIERTAEGDPRYRFTHHFAVGEPTDTEGRMEG